MHVEVLSSILAAIKTDHNASSMMKNIFFAKFTAFVTKACSDHRIFLLILCRNVASILKMFIRKSIDVNILLDKFSIF